MGGCHARRTLGDISITANSTGVLVPALELKLGSERGGTLGGLLLGLGDRVHAGFAVTCRAPNPMR
jgi:hypothetical protein